MKQWLILIAVALCVASSVRAQTVWVISTAADSGLTISSPAAFTAFTVPENLTGVTENTGQLIEVAGVGKITAPIRTRNGDYVFLRPAKSEVPKDDSTAEETKLFVQRISGRNAYFTSMGLIQDLTAPPEPEAAK